MPSIKMKTKSTTDCLKEKNGLQVCRMSSMISKNPLSHARVCQNAEACTLRNQDGFVYEKVRVSDLEGDKALHDESCNKENLSQKCPSAQTDSTAVNATMEPMLSTSPSNIETIFSPMLESIDFYNNQVNINLHVPQLDTEDSDDSRISPEHQGCNVSDFYISDMILSEPSIGTSPEFDNKTDTVILPDYKCEESSLLCDLTDECLVLPFLEDSLDAGCEHSDRPSPENVVDPNNSSLYGVIHQLRFQSDNHDSHNNPMSDQDYECFDPQMYIRNLPDQLEMAFTSSLAPALNGKQNTKSVTLVLDLDETLVHSTLDHCDDADFTFPVVFNMKEHMVYVRKRPHLQTFLDRVAEMFEVVVFTASQSIYAGKLLDFLDPEGKVISKRAYRESCIFSEGTYVKDLTVLGVNLAKIAIIDNTPQVYRLQVNNGIPIKSWFDDRSDYALISLLPFLETLVDADDVRPIIARKFGSLAWPCHLCYMKILVVFGR